MLLEKASVLFNIGALYTQIGTRCNRQTEAGLENAVDAFQRAAGTPPQGLLGRVLAPPAGRGTPAGEGLWVLPRPTLGLVGPAAVTGYLSPRELLTGSNSDVSVCVWLMYTVNPVVSN